MTYQLNQDAHQSTALGAQAQAVRSTQARVAKAAVEMREATDAYSAALATYETAKRREGVEHVCAGECSPSEQVRHEAHRSSDRELGS